MAKFPLVDEMREAIALAILNAEAMRKVGIVTFSMRECQFQLDAWKTDDPPASKELTDVKDRPQRSLMDGLEWEELPADEA